MARMVYLGPVAVAVVMTIGFLLAHGGGVSQAQVVNGDLQLDWETTDNTATSVGTVDSGCRTSAWLLEKHQP